MSMAPRRDELRVQIDDELVRVFGNKGGKRNTLGQPRRPGRQAPTKLTVFRWPSLTWFLSFVGHFAGSWTLGSGLSWAARCFT